MGKFAAARNRAAGDITANIKRWQEF